MSRSSVQIDPLSQSVAKRTTIQGPVGQKKQKISHELGNVPNPRSSHKSVTIEDETQDIPIPIQDHEPDDEMEDDRFFGSGLSEEQTQALDFLDAHEKDNLQPEMALDIPGMRKMAARFERAITKNQKLRARFGDEPTKFLESEAELDTEIKGLSVLSEYPNLYKDFVDMGCLGSLASLIGHENSDIVCDVITVIEDLTDEETNATEEEVSIIVEGLKACQTFELLTQNLTNLQETSITEREGVYKTLSIMENVATLDSSIKIHLIREAKVHSWLLSRMRKDESSGPMSQIKQYAAELLSILIQDTPQNILEISENGSVDSVLILLAPYRKRQPEKGSTDEEFLENCFDILSTLVTIPDGKDKFLEGEGVELMQRLITDAKQPNIRSRALQVIEYACGSWTGGALCAHVIEAGLLGTLFSLFMKKEDLSTIQTCLGIFNSFFRTLNDGEAERIRVINKFIEKQFQKTQRLLEVRRQFQIKHNTFLAKTETDLSRQQGLTGDEKTAYELTRYLDRLENGLNGLQLVDTILAWLIASDESIKSLIMSNDDGDLITGIKVTLNEVVEILAENVNSAQGKDEGTDDAEHLEEYDMMLALLEVLNKV